MKREDPLEKMRSMNTHEDGRIFKETDLPREDKATED
jgi:hypothetical protein